MIDSQLDVQLSISNVSHSYDKLIVLKDINLTVRPGEFVVLVGPSGCGKTTLLNILSGYLKPTTGTVQNEGIIRTVYQQDGLFPWLTVGENITMGLKKTKDKNQRRKDLQELLELIHLQGFED